MLIIMIKIIFDDNYDDVDDDYADDDDDYDDDEDDDDDDNDNNDDDKNNNDGDDDTGNNAVHGDGNFNVEDVDAETDNGYIKKKK